ncbi:SpoVG family protein [Heliomicrobium undosum]|uniref:SpoVG family protein n=1 Tax=Heliomicrobium undosum TaxID=121734 RepID=UPI002E2AD515|nr:SpoVG family protein [Heliomicrobium undosum]
MKALVSVTIDDSFAVHEIKVIEGKNGLFIAMPSQVLPDGTYQDIVHPLTQETRDYISNILLEAFNSMVEEMNTMKRT